MSSSTATPTFWSRLKRWSWLGCRGALIVLLAFGGAVLIGLVPVNRDFVSAKTGVELFVYADLAHSEIVVPLRNEVRDWGPWFSASDFRQLTGNETHVSFGWGDRDFFLTTPTWGDVKASTVARSMLTPTGTVMHVVLKGSPAKSDRYRRVVIEPEAYERMVEFIESHFLLDGSQQLGGVRPRLIAGEGYGNRDAFYEAVGTYSLLYTCNAWTGDALQVAGVRTGRWTPFPIGILQVPSESDASR